MKKLVLLTGVILIACVVIGSMPRPDSVSPQAEETALTTAPAGYVIADSDGKVAVFLTGAKSPLLVTDTLTDSLPRADAKRIRAGINIADKKELERTLEDFCS